MITDALATVRAVGSALPADVLSGVVAADGFPGRSPDDYRLELGLTPREAANRAWAVLTAAYGAFREAVSALPEGDRAVGLTREKWLAIVLRELDFGRVPTTPAGGLEVEERKFPVSHSYATAAGLVPIHLLGWGVELDRRTPGQAGAADRAPHAMVQEYLNRSDQALWGVVSNGRRLRLLRDSSTLVGQSFVEFDLEAMFDGEVFSDFVVLYLVCHATRFDTKNLEAGDDPGPADCWLERWRTHAAETGTRALAGLRPAVARAVEALGTGFAQFPGNDLHRRLDDRELTAADLHHSLLRLVYRLLFCFVAEDRGLLLNLNAGPEARRRYADWFSTARLRRLATRRRGSRHGDVWAGLSIVLDGLGREGGRPEIGIPGLGGIFELGESDVVSGLGLSNAALLEAVRHLTVVQPAGGGPKRRVDYRNLGAEELGSVYESLLELSPRYDPSQRRFSLEVVVGNERKTSGAYYTPASLIECLLDSALDPLLDDAEKADDPETALLALTVCDPACGSGHFLVAAAKRIAARLATARARSEGSEEPTPLDAQSAMHDVVDRCIFGVDLNPLAAELAKVSLWLESVQPGRALNFLDAHIKVGNGLLGATPALLAAGIPEQAFTALDGDDKKTVTSLKKRNREESQGHQGALFTGSGVPVSNQVLAEGAVSIDRLPGTSLADVHAAAKRHRDFDRSPALRTARLVADAWCAAFVVEKTLGAPAITQATLEHLADGSLELDSPEAISVRRIAAEYRFFHWHLEFPQIFLASDDGTESNGPGWEGGFTCVLSNPPWERIKLQEQEFFAAADPEIAGAPNAAARKRLIARLPEANPRLFAEYAAAKRRADGESQFLRLSGRYPLCGRGDINTYAVFAEHTRSILGPVGRLGIIVPTGIATDATTQYYFKDLVDSASLVSLYDFENRRSLFEGIDSRIKFCLLTLAGREETVPQAEFAFFQLHPDDLAREGARFELTPDELRLLNPNTGTCPIFRTRRDAEITLGIYRRHPVLINENLPEEQGNPWGLSFMRMFDMSNDSGLFHTRADLESDGWTLEGNVFTKGTAKMLPLYEAKMIHHYDHRWATYDDTDIRYVTDEEKHDPSFAALPRYWVTEAEVKARLEGRWDKSWLLGFRDIARSTDERTMISALLPMVGVGNKVPLMLALRASDLVGTVTSSIAFDFVTRQKAGGTTLNFFIVEQLPAPLPGTFGEQCRWGAGTISAWLHSRSNELVVTADDISDSWTESMPAFEWDPERRAQLRAELDAAFFHIYGLDRADTEYVLSTFPIANRNDPELTPRILREYDAMQAAIDTGIPYQSPLDPPPGQGARHSERHR